MTTTAPVPAPVLALPSPDAALPHLEASARARVLGSALAAAGALLLGLVLQAVVVSPLHESRDQHVRYDQLRSALANGTAPVGQISADDALLPTGTPVAILRVPALHLDAVVSEGTTSQALLSGPGHRRDTPLPGQSGASVVMGRQSTFGGPFAHLDRLTTGATITTVTGQGTAVYRVTGVRRSGSALPAVLAPGAGRLTLVSATGTRFLPSDVVRVDAQLVSDPFVTPRAVVSAPELAASERAFAGDPDAWPWLVIALAGLVLVALAAAFLRGWWGRWQTWLTCGPALLLLGLLAGQQVFVLLPNLL
ncbi:sortase [Cellulomonas alba]|uniref:Sortase n=1 Tax=Cellulomonas alba TaxID=3053467 RepID=A0ABT7SH46_9CELL|nr:sortase [Cellulomonas alba]MDM7855518.1 sortase [Cellulomonas alba]